MKTLSPIQPNTIVARAREVKFDQLDEEHYAVDSQAGYFYNMNETGNRVWDLLASPISVDDLCAPLRKEYRVDAASCLQHVIEILTQLREAGLIRTDDTSAQ